MPVNLTPSNADTRTFKVAAVQAEPAWLDLEGSVNKTIKIINEAASNGAKIIGFPEVFIPGYPWTPWAQNFAVAAPVLKAYQANSLPLHSPEMQRIQEAVKAAGVEAVLGFSERDAGSLYIAQVTITSDGRIANHRRKIKPTHYEKTIYGDGSAQSVFNVVQTKYGRLGSLNCTILKAHFYSQHPQIFVGGWWPAFAPHEGGSPYIVSGEASSRMTQMVAMEGSAFGIVGCQVVSKEGAEKMKLTGFPWFKFPGGGFSTASTIYGPDGSQLVEPVDPGVETILYADISLDKIDEVKLVADNQQAAVNTIHGEVNNLVSLGLKAVDGDDEESA
ncbi:nitrilase, putative [Rhizoctonia solani AG-1 IA]|uniref:Nitrilase, putative n=1 Tax=Thanatephorus cucumeris (strain AG1-IA) TaxID=983506 RepID=L8WGW8_THACA|nr:nitrilase, putative [Rhizoctonia solani AG-1 IA]